MKVLFISPKITMDEYDKADVFLKVCRIEVENYILETSVVSKLSQLSTVVNDLNKDMLIVIFNNNEDNYSNQIKEFIETAKYKEIGIWPVAINEKCRTPMCNLGVEQSYDVWEQLRLRNLDVNYLETVAKIFARKIISRLLPTLYSDNSLLFLSHRRLDGEEITATLCDQLNIQATNYKNFRDVVNVEVGQEAQEVIDSALSQSDILVFIHTEKSGESKWIEKELIYAVLNSIPIIWLRIDNADISKLRICPCHKPHIECCSDDFNDRDKLINIVDEILNKSFELIMLNSNNVFDRINSIKGLLETSNLKLIEEDKRFMIYNLTLPRKGYMYPQRNINQYIQCFGRRYKPEDIEIIKKYLESKIVNDYRPYDSAVLLSDKVKVRRDNDHIIEENYEDFYCNCQKYINQNNISYDSEIIISGAFPECDEIYKQSLYDAVNIFSKEIIKNGFTLTFGAHPTFQNIIFEIAKKFRPNDYSKAIKMFISKFFKNSYNIFDLKANATVTETNESDGDLIKSLTEMRIKMINRSTVKALVCLGGVIRNGDNTKGIDEEIKIARTNNIPVYLIGSVGGRSSQLASEYRSTGEWIKLNEESNEFNEELALNLDYRYLANKVIDVIKNKN